MKYLKLLAWMLAPLFMIVLGYLFLLPMPPPPPAETGITGVVILDPVDRAVIDTYSETLPVLAGLRAVGMCGDVVPNGSESMDEAIREILTGKAPTQLRHVTRFFDPDTGAITHRSPWTTQDGDLISILKNNGFVLKTILLMSGADTENGHEFLFSDDPIRDSEQVSAETADVILIRAPRMELEGYDYLKYINDLLEPYEDIVSTWILVSPMHHRQVKWRFHVNQWLLQNNYLTSGSNGNPDIASSPVFMVNFPGNSEPGLRVNRELSYSFGVVPRTEFEGLRMELGSLLRRIRVPFSPGNGETAGRLLFTGIYRGEHLYTTRSEGMYPEIAWEQNDSSVEIVATLLPNPLDSPWQRVPENTGIDRPGGWMCLSGPPFDIIVRDESKLNMLMAADITPTVLFLLGLPTAADMQGRILQPLMTEVLQLRIPAVIEGYSVHDPLVQQEF